MKKARQPALALSLSLSLSPREMITVLKLTTQMSPLMRLWYL